MTDPKTQLINKKKSIGVTVIVLWMILAPVSFIFPKVQLNFNADILPQLVSLPLTVQISLGVYLFIFLVALGLFIFHPIAWATTIVLFGVYALVDIYIVYFKITPSFSSMVEFYSLQHPNISSLFIKGVLFAILIGSIIWPVIVILFLIHPRTKAKFHRLDLVKLKKLFGDIKPG